MRISKKATNIMKKEIKGDTYQFRVEFMNFIKNLIICFVCICCFMVADIVLAEDSSPYAQALNKLGIFNGTLNGFEIERIPTRAEALVMIIRLTGKEQEALSSYYPHPFSDTGWEDLYVSYGYYHSIVRGISENSFGGEQSISLEQYVAMLLRVLGYTESDGDFTYENAVSFASLVLGEELSNNKGFNRGKMAELSCYALNTRMKNSSLTLGKALCDQGIFSVQKLTEAQKIWEQDQEYSSTTVLIYAIGSDLESQQGRLSKDLEEILRGEPQTNCKVLIQTGGTLTYHNEYMINGKAERFYVKENKLQKIDSTIQADACVPETLTDFMRWGKAEAPAQRYILVLWDHGYGIKGGFGADELNGRKTMRVSELCVALTSANVYFDIIAFDACLMGTVETAYALRNHAKYLIASEDSSPACGLYYTTWIGALERNPAITTRRLGRLILDSFTIHAGIEANIPTTISMMRTSCAGPLIDVMAEFKGNAAKSASTAKLLGENEGIFDQFDLTDIMGNVPEIMAAAQALAFEVRNSSGSKDYSGVAVYIPNRKKEDAPEMMNELRKVNLKDAYLNVIFNGIALESEGGHQ